MKPWLLRSTVTCRLAMIPCPICSEPIKDVSGICPTCAGVRSAQPAPTPPPASALPTREAPQEAPQADLNAPARPSEDNRRDERFQVPTDVIVRRLDPSGAVVKEERTVAHDLSRNGMRVLTSWSDLEVGARVTVQEVGGSFSTDAIVRHVSTTDRITRAGVEFLEHKAPDRLVGTTTGLAKPAFASAHPSNATAMTGKNPRPGPEDAHPPASVLTTAIQRPHATVSLPRPPALLRTTSIPRPVARDQTPAPPASPSSPEDVKREVEERCAAARTLVAESKIWEALEHLAKAQGLVEGTPEVTPLRILTWETQARVPSLMREAQQNLEDFVRREPGEVEAHAALGRIFFRAGLTARARVAFNRVLSLDPMNRGAAAALAKLNDPPKRG